jgi:hypothetical protein
MHGRPRQKSDKDAQEDLLALLDQLKALAEEATDANDDLAGIAELLRGAAAVEMQIASDYEKLTMWLTDIFPRVSAADQASFAKLGLGPFIPGGVVHLQTALWTAFSIGSLAAKYPALQAVIEKYKAQTAAGTAANKKRSDTLGDGIREMRDVLGLSKLEIIAKLPKLSRSTIYRKLAEKKS